MLFYFFLCVMTCLSLTTTTTKLKGRGGGGGGACPDYLGTMRYSKINLLLCPLNNEK